MSQPASQSVSTSNATNTAGTFALPLATLGVLMTAGIQGLLVGTIDRFLEQNLQPVFKAAVVLLAPVAVLGLGDFLRGRKRSHRLPSPAFRWPEAGCSASSFALSSASCSSGSKRRPLAQFAALGRLALWPVASDALRFTNDFLFGRRGGEGSTLEEDPAWAIISKLAMFANIYCLDSIGAGKTHIGVKPLLGQALFKWPGDGEVDCLMPEGRTAKVSDQRMRNALSIMDAAKGNIAQDLIISRARVAGRFGDVLIISPDAVQAVRREPTVDERAFQERLGSFKLLANGSLQALAVRLVSALTVMSNQEPNSYYREIQTEFVSNAFAILHETLEAERYILLGLWRFVGEEDFQKAPLEQAGSGNSIAYRCFSQQWAKEDPHDRMMLTEGFRADLTQFVSDEMRPTFRQAVATFPGWKYPTEVGKVVIFNMNLNRWGTLARALKCS